MSIVTPKVNYLLVNNPRVKIFGTAGAPHLACGNDARSGTDN